MSTTPQDPMRPITERLTHIQMMQWFDRLHVLSSDSAVQEAAEVLRQQYILTSADLRHTAGLYGGLIAENQLLSEQLDAYETNREPFEERWLRQLSDVQDSLARLGVLLDDSVEAPA